MKEEIEQIKTALARLEEYAVQNEPGATSPFPGLELPDIMRDVVGDFRAERSV